MEEIARILNSMNLFKNNSSKEERKEMSQLGINENLSMKDHYDPLQFFYKRNNEENKEVKLFQNLFSFIIAILLFFFLF